MHTPRTLRRLPRYLYRHHSREAGFAGVPLTEAIILRLFYRKVLNVVRFIALGAGIVSVVVFAGTSPDDTNLWILGFAASFSLLFAYILASGLRRTATLSESEQKYYEDFVHFVERIEKILQFNSGARSWGDFPRFEDLEKEIVRRLTEMSREVKGPHDQNFVDFASACVFFKARGLFSEKSELELSRNTGVLMSEPKYR